MQFIEMLWNKTFYEHQQHPNFVSLDIHFSELTLARVIWHTRKVLKLQC